MGDSDTPKSPTQHLYAVPTTIVVGTPQNFDARGRTYFTILAPVGSTVTFSRVNSSGASAHVTDPATAQVVVTADTISNIPVDWPFYRVSTAGGPCDVCLV